MTEQYQAKENISRTFAFDKRINQEDYLSYIDPN